MDRDLTLNIKKRELRSDSVLARQRGASLLEGIAYLGIAAIVVLGAVSLLTGAFGSAKSNQATEEVVAIRTAVRKLYIGQSYPTASLLAPLLAANAIPGTLARDVTAGTVTNSWGGSVTVTGTSTGFVVTYNSVPQDVCVNMLSGSNGWTQIAQGGTTITTFPVTVNAATGLCSVTGAAGNTITFTGS
ncbi:type 4 pilus major pilin [Herbaspirillum sp. RV1423]|uniref:type 4 pilus major pilin n=1 Tax=Herbaspirillum sp. RV1423 TaxID=1443993 RepID=UPI0004B82376|nr:type 4 pilus major pilin [Herbaspirillum sp. RV1423]